MGLVASLVLGISLSMDSFAASLGRGAAFGMPRPVGVVRTGAFFALSEVAALAAGWGAGLAASPVVAALDHWIAFALLAAIGGRMIRDGLFASPPLRRVAAPAPALPLPLVATALATSLDAAAVGMSLAFGRLDFVATAAAVGSVAFALAVLGLCIGGRVGPALGRRAETAGGLVLVGVGVNILIVHLTG